MSYLILPGEQEDDEGEDGRGEDDLHLGVQPRLQVRTGQAAIIQSQQSEARARKDS